MASPSAISSGSRISVRLTADLVQQIEEITHWMRRDPGIRVAGVKQSHAIRYLLERGLVAVAEERSGGAAKREAALVAGQKLEDERERRRERAEVEKVRRQAEVARYEAELARYRVELARYELPPPSITGPGEPAAGARQQPCGLTSFENEVLGCLAGGRKTLRVLEAELGPSDRLLTEGEVFGALCHLRSLGLVSRSDGPRLHFWEAVSATPVKPSGGLRELLEALVSQGEDRSSD